MSDEIKRLKQEEQGRGIPPLALVGLFLVTFFIVLTGGLALMGLFDGDKIWAVMALAVIFGPVWIVAARIKL
ncbi:MAG: hypothetical protein IAE79_01630 [Anaerolinea sp.]|nr:hypothetical protein [Anaerolinea sp.]